MISASQAYLLLIDSVGKTKSFHFDDFAVWWAGGGRMMVIKAITKMRSFDKSNFNASVSVPGGEGLYGFKPIQNPYPDQSYLGSYRRRFTNTGFENKVVEWNVPWTRGSGNRRSGRRDVIEPTSGLPLWIVALVIALALGQVEPEVAKQIDEISGDLEIRMIYDIRVNNQSSWSKYF